MVAANTRECFTACVGKRVTSAFFESAPETRYARAWETKTLVFDDGSGLTVAGGMTYLVPPDDMRRFLTRCESDLAKHIDALDPAAIVRVLSKPRVLDALEAVMKRYLASRPAPDPPG